MIEITDEAVQAAAKAWTEAYYSADGGWMRAALLAALPHLTDDGVALPDEIVTREAGMSDVDDDPATRHEYVSELVGEIAPKVWLALSGNGSLRVNIDTDVNCYGPWDPHGITTGENTHADRTAEAQDWVEYFVRSTINQLIDEDLLNAPGQD